MILPSFKLKCRAKKFDNQSLLLLEVSLKYCVCNFFTYQALSDSLITLIWIPSKEM